MKVALFLKESIKESELPTLLISKISEYGFSFNPENPDIVIFVGGDGTFLRAVQEYINQIDRVKFVGINQGSLGFYADYLDGEIDRLFNDLSSDNYQSHSFSLLETNLNGDILYSVNEVRIENPFHTLTANVLVNDIHFETYRGNGLCVSTTLGSSAYNKSLGGAVVEPGLEVLQISEIAPINNRVYHSFGSSLLLSKDSVIRIEGEFYDAVVGYDHLTASEEPHNIKIRLSDKKVTLIYKIDHSFVSHLHEAFLK